MSQRPPFSKKKKHTKLRVEVLGEEGVAQVCYQEASVITVPEGLEGVVANRHTGSEIQLFELGAELAEAEAGAVCDLGAAVQVQHFDVSAVLSKCPGKQKTGQNRFNE